MWQLTFTAPRGHRIHYDFLWVEARGMCFEKASQQWKPHTEARPPYSSSHVGPRTVKAFQRYLRKHPELQGHTVYLIHRSYIPDTDIALDVLANWAE